MKAIIEKKKLMQALTHLHGVVEKRNTIPILANVLIEAKDKSLVLAATDMEIAELQSISCEVLQDGAVTTPAHILYDIVRKLPDEATIELESVEGKKLEIKIRFHDFRHEARASGRLNVGITTSTSETTYPALETC